MCTVQRRSRVLDALLTGGGRRRWQCDGYFDLGAEVAGFGDSSRWNEYQRLCIPARVMKESHSESGLHAGKRAGALLRWPVGYRLSSKYKPLTLTALCYSVSTVASNATL
jgi:hypothetical protein